MNICVEAIAIREHLAGSATFEELGDLALAQLKAGDAAAIQTADDIMRGADASGENTVWPHYCFWAAARVYHDRGDDAKAAAALQRAREHVRIQLDAMADEVSREAFGRLAAVRGIRRRGERGVAALAPLGTMPRRLCYARRHEEHEHEIQGFFYLRRWWRRLKFSQPAPVLAQTGNERDGCMNQWLFNGVWRAQVTKVEPIMDGAKQTGWQVTQSWRNGTSRELAPADSAMKDEQLALSSGTLTAEGHRQEGLAYNTLAPSGQFTYTQTFFGPNMSVDPSDKPKALDVSFNGTLVAQSNKPHFTSDKYNFHYDLACVASGAAAQAEGGSTQLAATRGLHEPMDVQRRLEDARYEDHPESRRCKAADQNGWRVTQEWVNVTNRNLFPGGLPDASRHAVQSNVSDEFLATKSGNNASTFNMVGGFAIGAQNVPFPPGGSYTFEQPISWSPFDATDTPTRLLVTFDTTTQMRCRTFRIIANRRTLESA